MGYCRKGAIAVARTRTLTSKASIAEIVGVSRTALRHFIRTRKQDPTTSTGQ